MEVKEEELKEVVGGATSSSKCPNGHTLVSDLNCTGCVYLKKEKPSSDRTVYSCDNGVSGGWTVITDKRIR